MAALTDDSDQWRDEKISNKPFKNQLAAEQVLFGFHFQPDSLTGNSGVASLETQAQMKP